MAASTYTIGRAARAAGVGVETVRFYERKGLIERPPKPFRGARCYPQATVDRIRALRQGQELGLSLAQIDALLALRADPQADCGDVRERAEAHLEDVERKRARLAEIAAKLRELIAACPGTGATRACAILDAFTPSSGGDPEPGADTGGPRIELRIEGMACSACAGSVRALLRATPGVHAASVDLVSGVARVAIDPDATSAEAVARRLSEAGYAATGR